MAAGADETGPLGDHPEGRADPGGAGSGRDDEDPGRSLWRGLISLAILLALVVSLLLAVPGLHGVADEVADMQVGWVAVALVLEILSCVGYVIAFLQVFDRAPVRFGARVALSELAFGAAVSLGGAGSIAVGAWLLVDRGGNPARIAERSAVLFLLTSAVNVVTLVLAGLGLYLDAYLVQLRAAPLRQHGGPLAMLGISCCSPPSWRWACAASRPAWP